MSARGRRRTSFIHSFIHSFIVRVEDANDEVWGKPEDIYLKLKAEYDKASVPKGQMQLGAAPPPAGPQTQQPAHTNADEHGRTRTQETDETDDHPCGTCGCSL